VAARRGGGSARRSQIFLLMSGRFGETLSLKVQHFSRASVIERSRLHVQRKVFFVLSLAED
jgi:hypothetical protein